jgi:hypothetical protein
MQQLKAPDEARWPKVWPRESFRAGPTALLILSIVGAGTIVLLLSIAWFVSAHQSSGTRVNVPIVPAMVIQLILEAAIVAILLVGLPIVSRLSLRQLGFTPISPGAVGTAVVGAIVMAIVVNGGASLVETLTHQQHQQQVVEMFKAVKNPAVMVFFGVFAITLAPIAEEIVFRVFIFNVGLRYGGFWLGAVVSGVLFGLAHGDLFVLAPLALGGLVLCYVYYRTRNAYASMITHGLFNSITVFALIFAPNLAK